MKEIAAATISRWRTEGSKGSKTQRVNVWLYTWAAGHQPGDQVPDEAEIIAGAGGGADPVSVRRATCALELAGVLARDGQDGPFRVA
jgi:hypothetical protein